MKKIFTIGTSNRQPDDFIELLKYHQIGILVDVRRFPTSKLSHFKKEKLSKICLEHKIGYIWLGDLLGGFRNEGYDNYMQTEQFNQGLKRLEQLGSRQVTAFCCAEKEPRRCHRRFIAEKLSTMGWQIVHIIDAEHTVDDHQMKLF